MSREPRPEIRDPRFGDSEFGETAEMGMDGRWANRRTALSGRGGLAVGERWAEGQRVGGQGEEIKSKSKMGTKTKTKEGRRGMKEKEKKPTIPVSALLCWDWKKTAS